MPRASEFSHLLGTVWIRKRDSHPVRLIEIDDSGCVRLEWKYYGGKSTKPRWWTTWPQLNANYEPGD